MKYMKFETKEDSEKAKQLILDAVRLKIEDSKPLSGGSIYFDDGVPHVATSWMYYFLEKWDDRGEPAEKIGGKK